MGVPTLELGTEARRGLGPPASPGVEAAPADRAPSWLGPMRARGCCDWSERSADPPTPVCGPAAAPRQGGGLPLPSISGNLGSAADEWPRPLSSSQKRPSPAAGLG